MSDLDDLLNSLTETPSTNQPAAQQDELDDVLNALNDMVEKKQTKTNKQEDNLDDLLDSLDDKPKPSAKADDLDDLLNDLDSKPKTQKADGLDELLGSLDEKPKESVKAPAPKKEAPKDDLDDLLNDLDAPAPKKEEPKKLAPKDDLDDLLDGLDDTPKQKAPTAVPAKQAPKDDLDDLLDGLNETPKPAAPAQPKKQAPKDDLDDLLDGLDEAPKPKQVTKSEPKKQAPKDDLDDLLDGLDEAPKPKQATPKPKPKDDLDDLLDGLDDAPVKAPAKQAPKDDLDDLLDGLENKPAAPKSRPKDDIDDLLDDIDTTVPRKPADAPMTAIIDENPNICAECGQPLGPRRITALGRNYHPEHFVCKKCKTPLGTNPFHNVDGCPYCPTCYVQRFAKICARCGKPITDQVVSALGKTYHKNCFVCKSCGKPFPTPSFYQKNNDPYCKECYEMECAVKCAGCGKPIIGSSLMALNKKYHPECFVCSVCHAPFPRGQFYNLNGKPVCAEHKGGSDGNICAKCKNNIAPGTSFITALGKKFHSEHFCCTFCVTPLTESSFKENNGNPYCFSCYDKLFG